MGTHTRFVTQARCQIRNLEDTGRASGLLLGRRGGMGWHRAGVGGRQGLDLLGGKIPAKRLECAWRLLWAADRWRGTHWAGRRVGQLRGRQKQRQRERREPEGTEGTGPGEGKPAEAAFPHSGAGQTCPLVSLILVRGVGTRPSTSLSFRISHYPFWLAVDGGKWPGEVRFSLLKRQRGRKGPEVLLPARLHFKQPVCFIS